MQIRALFTFVMLCCAIAAGLKFGVSLPHAQEAEEGGTMLPPVVVTPESKSDMQNGGMPIMDGGDSIEIGSSPSTETISPLSDMSSLLEKPGDVNKFKPLAGFKLSVGDFGVSLMYSKYDMGNLSQILDLYEREMGNKHETEVVHEEIKDDDPLAELLKEKPIEPKPVSEHPMPNFYLGTVMYQNPSQWSIWVNQKRINASHPSYDFGVSGTIHVTSVSSNLATFTWTPADLKQAVRIWTDRTTLRSSSMKHRLAKLSNVDLDVKNKLFMVSMLNNQTFSSGTMEVVEGKLPEVDTDKTYTTKDTKPALFDGDAAALMLFDQPMDASKRQLINILKSNQALKTLAKELKTGKKAEPDAEAAVEGEDGESATPEAQDEADVKLLKQQLMELVKPNGGEDGAAAPLPPETEAAPVTPKGKMDIQVKSDGKDVTPPANPNVPPIPKMVPLPLSQPQPPESPPSTN